MRIRCLRNALTLIIALAIAGCEPTSPASSTDATAATPEVKTSAPARIATNQLRFEIDGRPWAADQNFFGAVNPPGFGTIVIMSGSLGPKDANEQAFVLNLLGVNQPGRYRVHSDDVTSGAVQLAGLSEQNYLIGGILGYDIEVNLTMAQKDPVRIEAQFEGSMNGSDGQQVKITAGHFQYRE